MASESEKEAILDLLAEEGHTVLEEPRRATRTSSAAVAVDYVALDYVSDEFKGDKDVMLAAVAQDGRALYRLST